MAKVAREHAEKISSPDNISVGDFQQESFCEVSLNIHYRTDFWFDSINDPKINSCPGPCQVNSATSAAFRTVVRKGLTVAENSPLYANYDVNWILSKWPGTELNGKRLDIDPQSTKILIGPNVLEGDNDNFADRRREFSYVYHLAPAQWVADAWLSRGWHKTIGFCPSPVDTRRWSPNAVPNFNTSRVKRAFGPSKSPYQEAKCIFYKKRICSSDCSKGRDFLAEAHPDLVGKAESWLKDLGIHCQVFSYHGYQNEDLRAAAAQADFALIVDGTETQGYAVQSIMSMDVPVFLVGNSVAHVHLMAPYFDRQRSGAFATLQTKDSDVLAHFLGRLPAFRPREVMVERVGFEAAVECVHRALCRLKAMA